MPSPPELCITHTTALPTHGAAPVLDATIVVADGIIASIAPGRGPVPPATRVIDGRGTVCMPGLVNCHTHVAMTLLRGQGADLPLQRWLEDVIWPAEERLTDEDVACGALLGCLEMLRGGVTAFADMYDHCDAIASAVERSGMRAVLSRGVIGLRSAWRDAMKEGEMLCRRYGGGPSAHVHDRITTMLAPHAEYTCPPEVWAEAVALARRLGVPIHTHVAETASEVEGCRVRHGCSPVRFLADAGVLDAGLLAAHCVHVDADDIALLAGPTVAVSHNPVSNAKLGSGIAPVEAMRAAGVRLGFGSDSAASTDFLGMWEEARAAAWLQKAVTMDAAALPAAEALRLATAAGAEALGLPAGAGRLAPGAAGDFILVDGRGLHQSPHADLPSSLLYAARDADVRLTVVAGRVVMEAGEFPGIDHERIAAEALQRSRRLMEAV